MVIDVYPTVVMNFVNMILKRCSTIKLFSTESALLLMLLCFVFLVCFLWLAVVWTDVRVLPQNISLCSFTTFKIRFLRVSFYWCFISFHLRRFNVSSCKKKSSCQLAGSVLLFKDTSFWNLTYLNLFCIFLKCTYFSFMVLIVSFNFRTSSWMARFSMWCLMTTDDTAWFISFCWTDLISSCS